MRGIGSVCPSLRIHKLILKILDTKYLRITTINITMLQ